MTNKAQLIVFLLSALSTFGATQPVNLQFDSVTLSTGKKLEKVVVKSYDPANGRVLMMANRHLVTYQLELFPENEAQQIANYVPAETAEPTKNDRIKRIKPAKTAAATTATPMVNKEVVTQPAPVVDEPTRLAQVRAAQSHAQMLDQAKRLAGQRVDRYYRLEFHPATGSMLILDQSLHVDEPVEIINEAGRYHVTGTIGLQYYDDRGRHTQRVVQAFDVVVGPDPRGVMAVLDFKSN